MNIGYVNGHSESTLWPSNYSYTPAKNISVISEARPLWAIRKAMRWIAGQWVNIRLQGISVLTISFTFTRLCSWMTHSLQMIILRLFWMVVDRPDIISLFSQHTLGSICTVQELQAPAKT